MLTIFRRHLKSCPQTSWGYRLCKCPIHVMARSPACRSGKASTWTLGEAAQALIREWETKGKIGGVAAPSIKDAAGKFEAEAEASGVRETTMVLVRRVLKHFGEWCDERGYRRLSDIGIDQAREYRASWTYKPMTATRKLERLRALFRFCRDSGWIEKNPFTKVQAARRSWEADDTALAWRDRGDARGARSVSEQGRSWL
jgi:hypothetical protein